MLKYKNIALGLKIIMDYEEQELEKETRLDGSKDKRYKFNKRDLSKMIQNKYTGLPPSVNSVANWLQGGNPHPDFHYSINELMDQVFCENGKYYIHAQSFKRG